jgi:hypothetical protein
MIMRRTGTKSLFGGARLWIALAAGLTAANSYAQPLLDEVHTLSRAAPAVERTFDIATAGGYDLQLTDFAAPKAFISLRLIVTRGSNVVASVDAPGTVHFAATAGTYQVHVFGNPDASAGSGTFGVHVVSTGGSTAVLDLADAINAPAMSTDPTVSTFQTQFAVTVAGTYSVVLTDFGFPAALNTLTLNIVGPGGSSVFAMPPAGPGTFPFTATVGSYELFVISKVASPPDSGSYGVEVTDGTRTVFSDARTVNTQTSAGPPSFTYSADVAAAGSLHLAFTDFQFPASLQSVQLNVTQGGASLGTLRAPGELTVSAAAGPVFVSVVVQPVPASANGLFGVQVTPTAGGTALIDVTQGAGPLFDARAVDVTQAGSYDVTLSDLGFPAVFTDLDLAVTRGTDRVGRIFGGGTFSFAATPGRYFLNFIASPNPTAKAGTYGLSVSPTPPVPVVTLAANPTSVSSGATTTLTWSTTDATSCVASGAWSGSKSTSGTETSAAVTAASTFTLTCGGPGGSSAKSVSVSVSAPASQGGGGALGWPVLLVLGAGVCIRARRAHSLYIGGTAHRARSAAV